MALGPAIAIIWGWVPALIWVVFGSIFIGAVHDFGALILSLRNRGRTIGDLAGELVNARVKRAFLFIIFIALFVVLAHRRAVHLRVELEVMPRAVEEDLT